MIDRFGRTIDYLRISVTDRCNLRCRYCMPEEGVPLLPAEDILSFEEIVDVARTAINLGIIRIRLTGGEPLVRRNVAVLVRMLASIGRLADLSMTTNGQLLDQQAEALASAGLQRVNVSLDAINARAYAAITGGGNVRRVLAGIRAAREAGLRPIKLNCVIIRSPEERDARDVAEFAAAEGLEVRFIRQMNLATGQFAAVHGGSGGDCRRCTRLRLSSNGQIRPCLLSNLGFPVRELGAPEALRQAVAEKPSAGSVCTNRSFHLIGG